VPEADPGTEGEEPAAAEPAAAEPAVVPEPAAPEEEMSPLVDEAKPAEGATDAGASAASSAVLATPLGEGPVWDQVRMARDEANWDQVEELLEGLLATSPSDALGHYHLAVAQSRKGLYSQALEHARRAFEIAPQYLGAGRLTVALARQLDRLDEVQPAIDEIAATQERNVDLQNVRVDLLIARKEYQRAIELAQSLL
jgi:tetratricopeptide (TPR) repeat protein